MKLDNLKLDCLLVHVPKLRNYYKPLNFYSSINWMSQGIWGLADALNQANLSTKIIHLGIETVRDSGFSLTQYIRDNRVRVVAFSMHFHQQTADILENIRRIKLDMPEVFVTVGGMTASFFSKDILEKYPEVDAVIRGEGEYPLPQLVQAVKSGRHEFQEIPNLSWRAGSEIIENPHQYTATQQDLNKLSFSNISYLENYPYYLEFPKAVFNTKLPEKINYRLSQYINSDRQALFGGLTMGRGCVVNCFYCGGGAKAQKSVNNRTKVVFRSHEKVIQSFNELKDYGFRGTYISFDPRPFSQAYYVDLFRKMRQQKVEFDIVFSAWALPSKDFLVEFSKTFGIGSSISISPETGSERLRKMCRGVFYDNHELFETIDTCENLGISTTVFFSLGVPGEELDDFQETLHIKDKIESGYKHVKVTAFLVEMEPAATWYSNPDKYGIQVTRRTLDDFVTDQRDPLYSSMSSIGYTKDNLFGKHIASEKDLQRELLQLKCRHFCNIRTRCTLMSAFWRLTNTVGLT